MGSIVEADDLAANTLVAIHSFRSADQIVWKRGREEVTMLDHNPPSPVPPGVPLQIIGTSLPFVACAVIEPGGKRAGPIIIDSRSVKFMRLAQEFVDGIVEFTSTDGSDESASLADTQVHEHGSDEIVDPA
jgi:hypothetical protein